MEPATCHLAVGRPFRARRSVWIAGGVVAAATVYVLARPAPTERLPPTSEVEALVGVPLSEPELYTSGGFGGLWQTVRTWWTYYTLPIPNQMVMAPPDGSWLYTFSTAPPFSPPATSSLQCDRQNEWGASCQAEGAGWLYVVDYSVTDSAGTVTAIPPAR